MTARIARRGTCTICGYRWPLRKDGTMQGHHLYSGNERYQEPCEGSGRPPRFAEENERAREQRDRIWIIPDEDVVLVTDTTKTGLDSWDY
jgi:hypothetical protein